VLYNTSSHRLEEINERELKLQNEGWDKGNKKNWRNARESVEIISLLLKFEIIVEGTSDLKLLLAIKIQFINILDENYCRMYLFCNF